MNYKYSKPELQSQLNSVVKHATQLLRDSGLNDAQIDNATHGRMDAVEIATDDDVPTLQFMLVSVVMDCQDVQRLLDSGEASEARGEVKALQSELERLDTLHLTLSGWGSKTGGAKGGKNPKRRQWAEWACNRAGCWENLPNSSHPWEFSLNDMEVLEVYRDGDSLIAADPETGREHKLARSTLEKRYF